jgi:hypothetical protein
MAEKLDKNFLEMIHQLNLAGEVMFSYTLAVDGRRSPRVRVASKVDGVHLVPNTLASVYESFPTFLKQAVECNEPPERYCKVEQTLWWDEDGSFRLTSVVRGSYSDLVLKAAATRSATQ